MSFLFPLYALGALAIAAPILFHLFQRKPHGQQDFSSLMFLTATPPKLTRRSRLSNWLLLLLRALALLLLAAAFGRPFLRSTSFLDLSTPTRSVALLVDTSASMRRGDLWKDVQASVQKTIRELQPTDQVSLIAFDRSPDCLVSFEAWDQAEASRRLPLLESQVQGLQPSWYPTDLGAALMSASDALLQQRLVEDHNQPLQVIVFSDLQAGSNLESLQSYEWPEEVSVEVRSVAVEQSSNASMQALPPSAGEMDASQVRVLVRNEPGSQNAQLQLGWTGADVKPVDAHVPPGQTRVVRITQPRGLQVLSLQGDNQGFDNELYVTEVTPQQKKLWYIGDDDANAEGLFFYLQKATLDTRSREVTIESLDDMTSLAVATPKQTPLIVVSKPLRDSTLEDAQRYVARGGRILVVLDQTADETMGPFLGAMLGIDNVNVDTVNQSQSSDYAMLSKIEFQHRLFQPFADPRFSDFTKIRFWSHRRLSSDHEEAWTNLARFDDGSPALVEKQVGEGTVWILTSGWQPDESQLALSTKFIPLLHGMFGRTGEVARRVTSYEVGQPIRLSAVKNPTMVLDPEGATHTVAAMTETFDDVQLPGLYQITQGGETYAVAVNIPTDESRTQPLMPDRLEQLGVQLGQQRSIESLEQEQRQMRNKELEGRQKLWRWGIVAALIAIALETWFGTRSKPAENVAAADIGNSR